MLAAVRRIACAVCGALVEFACDRPLPEGWRERDGAVECPGHPRTPEELLDAYRSFGLIDTSHLHWWPAPA